MRRYRVWNTPKSKMIDNETGTDLRDDEEACDPEPEMAYVPFWPRAEKETS